MRFPSKKKRKRKKDKYAINAYFMTGPREKEVINCIIYVILNPVSIYYITMKFPYHFNVIIILLLFFKRNIMSIIF